MTQTRQITVSRMYNKSGKMVAHDTTEDIITVKAPPEGVPMVGVSYANSIKLEIAPYQNASVHVGITLPCYLEEFEEAFATAVNLVEEKIDAEIVKIRDLREHMAKKGS